MMFVGSGTLHHNRVSPFNAIVPGDEKHNHKDQQHSLKDSVQSCSTNRKSTTCNKFDHKSSSSQEHRQSCQYLKFSEKAVEDEYHDFVLSQNTTVKNTFFLITSLLCCFVYFYFGLLFGIFSDPHKENLQHRQYIWPYFLVTPLISAANLVYSVFRFFMRENHTNEGSVKHGEESRKKFHHHHQHQKILASTKMGEYLNNAHIIHTYIETIIYFGNIIAAAILVYIDVTGPPSLKCDHNNVSSIALPRCHTDNMDQDEIRIFNELMIFFIVLPILLSVGLPRVRWIPQIIGFMIVLLNVDAYYIFYGAWHSTLLIIFLTVMLMLVIFDVRMKTMNHFLLFKRQKEIHDDQVKIQQTEAELYGTQLRYIIGGVAHDLKSPLSAFMLGVDTLQYCLYDLEQGSKTAPNVERCKELIASDLRDMRKAIEGINTAKRGMLMIINRCLDFNKVSNNIPLVPRPEFVVLQECIQLAIRSVYDMETKSTIVVDYVDPEIKDVILLTDKLWLDENLLCLLTNAVKYSSAGHEIIIRVRFMSGNENEPGDPLEDVVEVDACKSSSSLGSNSRAPSRHLSFHSAMGSSSQHSQAPSHRSQQSHNSRPSQLVCFEVENRGAGVSEEMLLSGALFDCKLRTLQQRTGGIGLGLYTMACRIKALHGKYGCIQSADSKRSVFWFAFPPAHFKHANDSNNNSLSKRSVFISHRQMSGKVPAIVNQSARPMAPIRPIVPVVGPGNEDLELGRGMDSTYSQTRREECSIVSTLPSNAIHIEKGGNQNDDSVGVGLAGILNRPPPIRIDRSYQDNTKSSQDSKSAVEAALGGPAVAISGEGHGSHSNSPATIVEGHELPTQQSISQSGKETKVPTPSNGHSSAIPPTPTYKFAYSTMRKAMVNSIAKLNVLVVDDSLPILKMSKMMLQKSGHNVTTAGNGQEALDLMISSLKSHEFKRENNSAVTSESVVSVVNPVKFDVVLMDLQMPIMDGIEAVRRYREFETKYLLEQVGHAVEKSLQGQKPLLRRKSTSGGCEIGSRSSSASFSGGTRISSFSSAMAGPSSGAQDPARDPVNNSGAIYLNNSTETDNLLDMYENSVKIVPIRSSKKPSFSNNINDPTSKGGSVYGATGEMSLRSSSIRTAALAAVASVEGNTNVRCTNDCADNLSLKPNNNKGKVVYRNASIHEVHDDNDDSAPQTGLFIIGVSANSDDIAIDTAIESGMDCFIPKPFGIQQFHGIISQHLYQDNPSDTPSTA